MTVDPDRLQARLAEDERLLAKLAGDRRPKRDVRAEAEAFIGDWLLKVRPRRGEMVMVNELDLDNAARTIEALLAENLQLRMSHDSA